MTAAPGAATASSFASAWASSNSTTSVPGRDSTACSATRASAAFRWSCSVERSWLTNGGTATTSLTFAACFLIPARCAE